MNIINIDVNFENKVSIVKGVMLTSGDYNSTKIKFNFDKEGTKVFKMSNPEGELIYLDQIQNDELILVGKDEEENPCSLFSMAGKHPFEVVLYGEDSKLTSAYGEILVGEEVVKVNDEVVTEYLPLLDEVMNYLNEALTEVNNLDISAIKENNKTTITIQKKDGTSETVEILDGEIGPRGPQGIQGETGPAGRDGYIQYIAGDNVYINPNDNSINVDLSFKQDIVQYSTVPTAGSNNEGKIIQYTGTTDSTYTNGYFYKCVSDGAVTPTYSWEAINVQASSGGGNINSFHFVYGESNSTSISTAQEIMNFYFSNGYFPRVILHYPYYGNDREYECEFTEYQSSQGRYYLSVYRIEKWGNSYFGTPYFEYLGSTTITIDNNNLVTYVYLPSVGTTNNGYYRRFRFGAIYGSIDGSSTYQSYINGCSALSVTNNTSYVPTGDYNPATKKYVDDSISNSIGNINTILATLTTPNNGGDE